MSNLNKHQKQNWYLPECSEEDIRADNHNKKNGAIASKITRTDSYIENSSRNFESLSDWKNYFPFIQEIKGDGFCALHSSITGILAKCVDDTESFGKFKDNLKKWANGLENGNKEEAKKTVDEILKKLQKDTLTYQDFYDLTSETGKDNVVNKLSVLLFKNTSFEENSKTGYPGSPKDKEQQKKYLSNPETMDKKSGLDINSVMEMLIPIFPFPIEKDCPLVTVVGQDFDIRSLNKNKNTIYLFHDGKHFDLLHSVLDKKLLDASVQYVREKFLDGVNDLGEELKHLIETDEIEDVESMFSSNNMQNRSKALENLNEEKLKKSSQKNQNSEKLTSPAQQKEVQHNSQKINLEELKIEFKVNSLNLPSLEDSKTFAKVATQKEGDVVKRLEKYGKTFNPKTEALIKEGFKNQDKVFANKFVRALNKLRNIIQDSESNVEEGKIWGNLTTLDKKVLIDYHNKNHEESQPVRFESLARGDLRKVLSSAVQEIPESSISGTEAKRLHKNIANQIS